MLLYGLHPKDITACVGNVASGCLSRIIEQSGLISEMMAALVRQVTMNLECFVDFGFQDKEHKASADSGPACIAYSSVHVLICRTMKDPRHYTLSLADIITCTPVSLIDVDQALQCRFKNSRTSMLLYLF